ncbi:hypothetical protein YPPY13_3864 [Yersinia pestis PY-13]|uniref:Uncharacterized protein n=1 Tax=Yersinia pestis PY-08 TaxID=992134 RepID=A0AB72ZHW1_YERPE|nr:hypothetical protein YPPY01_3788 [Yersinia pestis PY-01]EIQ85572.1 hypothetical protein YPPY02_3837 [Yersinia pestis PY-02]EIR03195.1 hypothetical protein YPPY06_3885 [Yersinia pestis PY-06]EIR13917.1 hypothetical protein YPPY07_3752 [Yersinia pestis PY-07]EIR14562.1 hypothetical protein YPPY08_3883 [Yersinia pestis PY-08]EIR16348.1 hypothetical protein YPPY09_3888 [Yersinia pestis PY-09]EIR28205.1 hypothetical protein YPPY10_3886 [Yersinia pestis PY-10]EIR29296.1 hypothetical protein YPP
MAHGWHVESLSNRLIQLNWLPERSQFGGGRVICDNRSLI